MATKTGQEQVEYWEGGVEILMDLVGRKPDRGQRQETWEQARERVGRLPEPERSQQLAWLDRLQSE